MYTRLEKDAGTARNEGMSLGDQPTPFKDAASPKCGFQIERRELKSKIAQTVAERPRNVHSMGPDLTLCLQGEQRNYDLFKCDFVI